MFDSGLDTERTFGHSREVSRTHVRRRRLAAGALLVLAVSVSAPAVSAAVTGGSSRRADVADRYVVQAIVDSNQVDAGTLVPGQVLVIPA